MKTKFLNLGMPVLAFLTAIVFAFSTENSKDTETLLVQGYIYENGKCAMKRTCNNIQGELCKFGGVTVRDKNQPTTCGDVLYHFGS